MSIVILTTAALGLVVFGLLYVLRKYKSRKGALIPGPKCLPLVGYALNLKEGHVHEQFAQLAEEYGDIFQIQVFGMSIVVLNTTDMIRKAFNSDPYQKYMNDRVSTFIGDWVFFKSQAISFMPKSIRTEHGYLRKAFVRGMPTDVRKEGTEFEESVIVDLQSLRKRIESYKGNEFDMVDFLKRSLANSVSVTLDGTTLEDDNTDLDMFWDFLSGSFLMKKGADTLLRNVPLIRLVPGLYKERLARLDRGKNLLLKRYFSDIKASYKTGHIRGLVDFMLNEQAEAEKEGGVVLLTDDRIKAMVLETIGAGIYTSLSAYGGTFLCLLNHPGYQIKIQNELDNVIGREKLPTVSDRRHCPMTEAVFLEAQRYISVLNISSAHFCETNIDFEGFDLPANSTILPNIWFVHHDKRIWGDPWTFRPERWLDENDELLPYNDKLRKNWIPFGKGRRQCIGDRLARGRMFLYIATLLQGFTLEFLPGGAVPCDPRAGHYDIDITICPKPFFCRAVPRV